MVANRQASYFSYVGLQRDMGQAWPLPKFIIHYHLEIFTRDHSYITSSHFWDFWTPPYVSMFLVLRISKNWQFLTPPPPLQVLT